MRNLRHFLMILVGISALVCSSCEHRVLTDPMNVHYIRVYLDEQIKNITYGFYNESYEHPDFNSPMNIYAGLASAETGEILSEGLIRNHGNDERGHYLDGYISAPAGDYHLIMYQLGSPVTHIKDPKSYFEMTAYTSPVSDRMISYLPKTSTEIDRATILEEPEHILASRCENIHIAYSTRLDTLRTATGDYFTATSIAKSYYLQLRITGIEWVHAAAAVLSGMAGSNNLCKEEGMVTEDPINLFFTMNYADKKRRSGEETSTATLYTTFTTFGKIPDIKSELMLNFEFTKKDGSTQVESIDITEAFKTQLAIEKQWLLLDEEIQIIRPEGTGGMTPGVEGWKDETADLPM